MSLKSRIRKLTAQMQPGTIYAVLEGGRLIDPATGEEVARSEGRRIVVVKRLEGVSMADL